MGGGWAQGWATPPVPGPGDQPGIGYGPGGSGGSVGCVGGAWPLADGWAAGPVGAQQTMAVTMAA